jgi:adenine-specific DNA-methyltransferase
MGREIFGESSQISALIWKSRQNKDNRTENGVSVDHEYIVAFGKTFRGDERDLNQYSNADNDPRGPWTSANMVGLATADRRPNLHYDLIDPSTTINYGCPPLGWRYEKSTMSKLIAEGRILWPADPSGRPRRKAFLSELTTDFTGYSSIIGSGIFTRDGTADISALFEQRVFDFPKPVKLIEEIIEQTTNHDSLVLDFFGGSGTTGHAVMAKNIADGGNRRYVVVQLPEPLDPKNAEQKTAADFCEKLGKPRNIAELTKERLRRAGAKLKAEHPGKNFDAGFRVYKLATSNLRPWQPAGDDLAGSLLDAVDNVLPDRSEDDLLVELMLKTGIDLAMPSETRSIAGQTVHSFGGGALMVCLGTIADAKAEELALGIAAWRAELAPAGQTAFWFKDSGFASAAAKANVAAILRQRIAASDIARIAAL